MTRRVLAFLIFLIAGGTVAPLAQSPQSPAKTGARLGTRVDLALADRLSRADDASVERVIIRMKPGTKRALLSQLQAQGARVRDRKSTRLNSSHVSESRMPSSA